MPAGAVNRLTTRGEAIGLPTRAFLYTLDQISELISIPLPRLKNNYLHYHGRSIGHRSPDMLLTRNIAPPGDTPEWRVAEHELVRWLKRKGFKLYDKDWVTA